MFADRKIKESQGAHRQCRYMIIDVYLIDWSKAFVPLKALPSGHAAREDELAALILSSRSCMLQYVQAYLNIITTLYCFGAQLAAN